jgi:hypothetical protein
MRWLTPLSTLVLILVLLGSPQTGRAQSPVVVEFFTSQGCASCPPADEVFAVLARRPDVVALALHVDYWDYLGWRDAFGRPEHTERQRAYAKAHRERTIYTPQMVIQGVDLLVGHEDPAIRERIAAHEGRPARARVSLRRTGGGVEISVAPAGPPVGAADVHLVEYLPEQSMTVEGGENAGYHHTFANVVVGWTVVGRWDGAAPAVLRHDGAANGPVAVLVQAQGMGPILTAAKLP